MILADIDSVKVRGVLLLTKASLLYIHIADLTFQSRKIMGVHSGNTDSSNIILATDAQKSTHHVGLLLINIFSNPFAVNASEILYFRSLFLAFSRWITEHFCLKREYECNNTDAETFFLDWNSFRKIIYPSQPYAIGASGNIHHSIIQNKINCLDIISSIISEKSIFKIMFLCAVHWFILTRLLERQKAI